MSLVVLGGVCLRIDFDLARKGHFKQLVATREPSWFSLDFSKCSTMFPLFFPISFPFSHHFLSLSIDFHVLSFSNDFPTSPMLSLTFRQRCWVFRISTSVPLADPSQALNFGGRSPKAGSSVPLFFQEAPSRPDWGPDGWSGTMPSTWLMDVNGQWWWLMVNDGFHKWWLMMVTD